MQDRPIHSRVANGHGRDAIVEQYANGQFRIYSVRSASSTDAKDCKVVINSEEPPVVFWIDRDHIRIEGDWAMADAKRYTCTVTESGPGYMVINRRTSHSFIGKLLSWDWE